jgi:hypothetical protein
MLAKYASNFSIFIVFFLNFDHTLGTGEGTHGCR